jgi:hypothetical protein
LGLFGTGIWVAFAKRPICGGFISANTGLVLAKGLVAGAGVVVVTIQHHRCHTDQTRTGTIIGVIGTRLTDALSETAIRRLTPLPRGPWLAAFDAIHTAAHEAGIVHL